MIEKVIKFSNDDYKKAMKQASNEGLTLQELVVKVVGDYVYERTQEQIESITKRINK